MINDKSLQSSVLNKFLIKPNDESVVIPKESIANISNGLTSVQNAFNQVKAYSTNISRIQRAIADASLVSKKESTLENRAASNVAPVDTGSDIASLFPQLSKALDELAKSFEQLNLSQQGGPGLGAPSPQGGGMGLGTMLAGGAIAAGIGGAMLFSGSAEAAEPEPEQLPPPTPEPEPQPRPDQRPAASEVSAKAEENIAEARSENQRTPQKIEQRERRAEAVATQTAQAALRQSDGARLERVRAPQPTQQMESWSSKLSSYIGQSVRATEARMAAQAAASPGGFDDGAYDSGAPGGATNPPTSGMGGLIYRTGKQLGYDDYMSIAFVALAEKESGLVPRAENMNYSAERAREVHGAASVQYIGNPVRFANYVYGPATRRGRGLGNTGPNDGWNYRGKGLNQLTGKSNFARIGRKINYDLVRDPDAVINNPDISVRAFFAFYDGHHVLRGRKSARSQAEANRIVTDATGGRDNYSVESDYGRENLAKVNRFSARYSAAGLASEAAPTAGAPGAPGGAPGGRIGGAIVRRGEGVSGMGYESARGAIAQLGISGTNGNLNSGQLEGIGVGSLKAAPPAARSMRAMRAAAAREGLNIGVTDAYRDYATQVRLKRQKPNLAATPGRSNHGWGLAFDLSDNGRPIARGSAVHRWLVANAPRFGIYGPLARPFEIWHWEYRGGGAAAPATMPVTAPEQQRQATSPTVRTPAGTTMNQRAITAPREECNCPEPVVVPAGGGGGNPAATAANYLSGARPPRQAIRYNVNTAEDYKIYFNAA